MISPILSIYKADTSDLKAKLKELQGEEKKLAQASLDAAEARNKAIDQWTKNIGKATIALGAAGAAVATGVKGLKAFGEEQRLMASAGATNIARLEAAFDGLVSKMDVLRFAAQSQHGIMKLTQEQMETIARSSLVLYRQGMGELADIMGTLQEAAAGAKLKGLDDLGLSVRKGATEAETLANIMDALNRKIAESGDVVMTTADHVERLGVMWENAKHSFLSYVGASLSLEATKEGHGLLFDIGNLVTFGGFARSLENRKIREANLSRSGLSFMEDVQSDYNEFGEYVGPRADPWGTAESGFDAATFLTSTNKLIDALEKRAEKLKEAREKAKRAAEEERKLAEELRQQAEWRAFMRRSMRIEGGRNMPHARTDLAGRPIGFSTSLGAAAEIQLFDEFGLPRSERDILDRVERERTDALTQRWRETASAFAERRTTLLESVFGPVEQIDLYKQSLEGLGDVFNAFTDAAAAGYTALVKGSEPIGKAMKAVAAASILAAGQASFIDALRETALGVASLALGPIGGASAALHFKAAGLHAAVAAAAGIAAKGLSSGGSASAPSGGNYSGGDYSAPSSRSGGGSGGTTVINYIITSGPVEEESPRLRQRNAERIVELATQRTSAGRAE